MNQYFDVDGNEVSIEDALYGKTETSEGNMMYYVKANKATVFDPFNNKPGDKLTKWALKKVSEEVYENYVLFITTSSIKFKFLAERKL